VPGEIRRRQQSRDAPDNPPVDWALVIGIAVGAALAWAVFVALLWVVRPRDVRLAELVRIVPDVFRLGRDIVGDRAAPLGVRAAFVGLVLWLVNPVDLIPEFIPMLGPLDDVVIAVVVLRYARRRLGDDELRRRWRGSAEGYQLLTGVIGKSR
jgi:uncharacterized membrane protein YkvA (DUF1232 family)